MTTHSTVYPESKASPAAAAASDGRSIKETLESVGPKVKQELQHLAASGKSHMTEWKGGLQEGIREKPIQYVLIAAAVGAAIGLLLGRRS